MLYELLYPLRDLWFGFNVFKYITFRAAMATVTAFLISIVFGPLLIEILTRLKVGQHIKKDYVEDLYELHKHKKGTPTMGGFIILIAIIASTVLWARLDNRYVIICLITLIWLGFVGFVDDYIKMVKERNTGLRASTKFIGQLLLGLIVGAYLYFDGTTPHTLHVPFIKDMVINLGILYIIFVVFVIVGSSNAVNLTDGLDGLAIGCVTIIAIAYSIICYVTGNAAIAKYLNIYFLQGGGELAIICAAIVGSGLGFLWFNSFPASVFMGDIGSLALGGAIGVISVLIKKEVLLVFMGGIIVAEVMSVILQVLSVKIRKKKLFLMSPIHHHFQLKGIPESKIIIRFWIVAIVLALISLVSLKLQ